MFDDVREYAHVEKDIDALLGYSMRRLCLEDAQNQLRDTRFTQPSLYVVNALHYYQAIAQGARPQFLAGHSLGEYDALLAAGCFDFVTGLKLVKRRGELMAQASGGGMAAVIGLPEDAISRVLGENELSRIDVANFNSPSQIVISGHVDDIKLASPLLERAGARMVMPLPVSAAFHSRFMVDSAKAFAEFLAPLTFQAPKLPVFANVTAQPYPESGEAIKSLLVEQITHSVRWTQSVTNLVGKGVTEFRELGPGNVLTRLVQQIRQESGV